MFQISSFRICVYLYACIFFPGVFSLVPKTLLHWNYDSHDILQMNSHIVFFFFLIPSLFVIKLTKDSICKETYRQYLSA